MQELYIARDGEAIGPVTLDDTNRMVLEGTLDSSTYVWDDATSSWMTAGEHPSTARIFERHEYADRPISRFEAMLFGPVNVVSPPREERSEADLLQREIAARRDELEPLEKTLELRRAELAPLEERLAAGHEELKRIEHDIETRRREEEIRAETAAREARDAGQSLEELRAEIARMEDEGRALEKRHRERSEALESLVAREADEKARRAAEAESFAKEIAERRKSLESEFTAQWNELDERITARRREAAEEEKAFAESLVLLRTDRESLASSLAALKRENEERRAAVEELERRGAGLSETVGDLEAKRRSAEAELNETVLRATALRDELSALVPLRADLEAAREEKRLVEGELESGRRAVNALLIERAACDAEIQLVRERLAAVRTETAELEEKRLEAQALLGEEVSRAFERIRATMGDLDRMTETWSEAQASDEKARRQGLTVLDELVAALRKREGEIEGLFGRLAESARAERETETLRAEAEEARARLERHREDLKHATVLCFEEGRRIEEFRAERDELRAEIDAEMERYDALQGNLERLKQEAAEVSGRLGLMAAEIAALESEAESLRREREIHEAAIRDLKDARARSIDANLEAERLLAAARAAQADAEARLAELGSRCTALHAGNEALEADSKRLADEIESRRQEDRRQAEERENLARMAAEARREVETELEEQLAALGRAKAEADRVEAARGEAETARRAATEERARIEDEAKALANRRERLAKETLELETRARALEEEASARVREVAHLREEEAQLAERRDRMAAELEDLERDGETARETRADLEARLAELDRERVELEKERAVRARADLHDLRELLAAREAREKQHLEALVNEARAEFRRLKEDWDSEERLGVTNDELRKLRDEVEERRRDLAKAERQLSAMRAGLSKLREENGRNLLRRIQSFETQQLEDLRKRLSESRGEIENLEKDWSAEMKSAELVEKQWFEIKTAVQKRA